MGCLPVGLEVFGEMLAGVLQLVLVQDDVKHFLSAGKRSEGGNAAVKLVAQHKARVLLLRSAERSVNKVRAAVRCDNTERKMKYGQRLRIKKLIGLNEAISAVIG